MEVKIRIHCSDCQQSLETWASVDITMKDSSDSYETHTTPELSFSPDLQGTGWTAHGSWTRRYSCSACSETKRRKK